MSCVLHIDGESINVDGLIRLSPVEPAAVFRKGHPRSSRPNSQICRTSGVALVVSDADFDDFSAQKREAEIFLRAHRDSLSKMLTLPNIEYAALDFGIEMRNVIFQSDAFEPSLIALLASLNLVLVLSQYPPAKRAKRIKQYRRALRSVA